MKRCDTTELLNEMEAAGFTRHERNNPRIRHATERLLCRGRLYLFDDDVSIEHGVSGPFNDDEAAAKAPKPLTTPDAIKDSSLKVSQDKLIEDPSSLNSIRNALLEEAALVCDAISADTWALYKGRPPYDGSESGRADPHVQGISDGADRCAEAIRALKTKEQS
jgi:hypothetical protein